MVAGFAVSGRSADERKPFIARMDRIEVPTAIADDV